MGLRDLKAGDYIYLLNLMTTEPEARAVLEGTPKLAPWIEDLEKALTDLVTAKENRDAKAEPPVAEGEADEDKLPEGRTLDRRAEGAVRILWWHINMLEDLARAQDDDKNMQLSSWVRSFLFPNGLAFLGYRWENQTGEILRLLSLANEDVVTEMLGDMEIRGLSWNELLELIRATNQELIDHLNNEGADAKEVMTVSQARRQAISLLSDIQVIADQALPSDSQDQEILEKRTTLLGELDKLLKAHETPPIDAETTTPPEETTTPEDESSPPPSDGPTETDSPPDETPDEVVPS